MNVKGSIVHCYLAYIGCSPKNGKPKISKYLGLHCTEISIAVEMAAQDENPREYDANMGERCEEANTIRPTDRASSTGRGGVIMGDNTSDAYSLPMATSDE